MAPNDASRRDTLLLAGATAVAIARTPDMAIAASRSVADLFATEAGDGKHVMLIHGWTCDSNDWCWQLPVFESKYRVVALDLRGHGKSEVMPAGSYTPGDYVADIEALISTRYNRQKFVVVGHSMGGQIAALLASRRPDLVSAVVSVDGALGFSDDAAQLFGQTARDLAADDPGVVVPRLFELVYDAATQPAFKRWHARRVQGMPFQVVRESFGPLFFGAGQVGLGDPSAKFCSGLTVPIYHLCRDPIQADRMRPWFSHPKSKVEAWSNTGHWIMQDRASDFNTTVTAYIDGL